MSMFKYECDEVKKIIDEVSPNYPQLTTFEKEWVYFHKYGYIPGIPVNLEYATVETSGKATVLDAIPYSYKSAILKGQTLVNVLNPETINFDGVSNLKMDGGNFTYDVDWEWGKFAYIIKGKPNTSYLIKHSEKSNGTYILFRHGVDMYLSTFTAIDEKNQVVSTDDSGQFVISIEAEIVGTDFIVQNLMVFEYKNGMENWDIPYIEGMKSVQMPVLTTSNEDGTETNILTVNEDVELRGIGEVKDELDLLNGELTQRIGEVVLDGSEYWVQSEHENSTMFYTSFNNLVRKEDYLNSISCDKLVVHTNESYLFNSTSPNGISAYADYADTYPNENWIYIKYADSEGDVEKLKQWLSQNPITVQYELATESVKTVDLTDKLSKPYEGVNHYETYSDTIPPIMFLEVPVVSTGDMTLLDIQNQD